LPEQSSANQQKHLEEVRRLKRWATGKKAPDVDRFQSTIFSREEKLIYLGLQEDAGAEDAPFPGSPLGLYP